MKERINISVDTVLLKDIDALADKMGQSRSGFLSMAAATYIQQNNLTSDLPKLIEVYSKALEQQ